MAIPDATPIIVGVGDFKEKTPDLDNALDPAALMHKAIQLALDDTGLSQQDQKAHLIPAIDGLSIVPPWTWNYQDLLGVVAGHLGVKPTYTFLGDHGGNQPGKQCDTAARRVSQGSSDIVVVTGGEALHTGSSIFHVLRCEELTFNSGSTSQGKEVASKTLACEGSKCPGDLSARLE